MNVTIWHNPRCSKSRATLALLKEHGLEPVERGYLDDAPTAQEIREAARLLGRPVIEFTRTGEALFKELGLRRDSDEETLIRALAENPRLIERPIVFANGKAALGRPPEAVLDIL